MLNELRSIWKRTLLEWESVTETLSYFSASAKYSYHEDDKEALKEFLQRFISHQDNIVIKLFIDKSDSYEFSNRMTTHSFSERILEFTTAVEQLEEEKFQIKLEINKKVKKYSSNLFIDHIYSIRAWSNYLQTLSIEVLNEQLHKRYHSLGIEGVILLGDYSINCSTDYFHFMPKSELPNDDFRATFCSTSANELLQLRSNLGHFANAAEWRFLPENFKFKNQIPSELRIVESVFNILHNVYLISFIANLTIINNGKVKYTLKGLKDIIGEYDLNFLRDTDASSLRRLYQWIYCSNSIDKIGIARNIIPLHVESLLSVNNTVLESTFSSFNLSQKNDVKSYIESTNKLAEQVLITSQKANDIAEKIANAIKSGVWGISTFAISTVLFRIFARGSEIKTYSDLFTFIGSPLFVGVMGFALFVFSILFSLAWLESNKEQKRFKEMYNSGNKIYQNVFTKKDIKNILSNDEHYKLNDKYISDKRRFYTFLWIITVISTATILLIASYNSNPKPLKNIECKAIKIQIEAKHSSCPITCPSIAKK